MSGDEQDNTETSDDENVCRDVKSNISGVVEDVESVNVQNCVEVENDKTQALDDVKHDIPEMLDDVGSLTAPSTSNVARKRAALDQDIASRSLRSGKRIKLDQDMTGE